MLEPLISFIFRTFSLLFACSEALFCKVNSIPFPCLKPSASQSSPRLSRDFRCFVVVHAAQLSSGYEIPSLRLSSTASRTKSRFIIDTWFPNACLYSELIPTV
ncbi:uncharacterized protein LDX57_003194 [Aspergillus melleus]|uniref:uncharacterized protein n=1 Tax=Aspergillus melleus TaxID=138277 RepID=UPI001E8E8BE6|nr:uncharacterized protein LDX57_003194 [Aspergillus melleus]KAH8425441.1 hypothetical protein LDX57_003194 [Aspergillus melleus]